MTTARTLLGGICLAALALAGCQEGQVVEDSATSVVLIDQSASINPADRLIYEQSITNLAAQLEPGDRLLIGAVGDGGRSDFRPLLDLSIPRTDIRVDRERAVASARAIVANALPRLLSNGGPSQRSRLVEGITAVTEAFGPPPHAGDQLVLLSDGVEDSEFGQLDRPPGEANVQQVLSRMRSAGLIPDLEGVSMSVIGAGGRDYAYVQRFWQAFAAESGGSLHSYGRLPYQAGRSEGQQ